MISKSNRPGDAAELRKRAEEVAREKAAQSPENLEDLSHDETRRMLHELRVHQIELEMQNEEMRRAHTELEASMTLYADLYDFAPVGYVTLSESGLIQKANLTAATLLGVIRSALIRKPLTRFILPQDHDIYYRHRNQLIETGQPLACELRMLRANSPPFWVRMDVAKTHDGESGFPVYRLVMSDITDRKRTEELHNQTLDQAKRRAQEVSALLKSARIVLDYADFSQASRKIFDVCCSITGATAGYVAMLSADRHENVVLFLESGGLPCSVSPDLPMPVRGLREQAYRAHKTVYENDFWNSRWMSYMPAGHCRLDNVLFAPLEIDGKTLGVMGLANKAGGFTDHDQRLVSALAELVAVSLRNSLTLKSLEEKEKKLQQAHDVMETRVKERTLDLNRANVKLMQEIEEHQRAAEALQQSEEKYRIVADNTYDWEFWIDPEDKFIYVSPACKRITGHLREEFESNPELITQIMHPEDLPRYLAHRHTAERNPASGPFMFRIRRSDGQERWIEHICQPVFDKNGTFLGNRGSNRDVTLRILSEEIILQSKKKLQAVFDGISEPLIFVDRNMTTQMANEAALRYYQYTLPQDMLGRSNCVKSGENNDLCDGCPIPSAVTGDKQVCFVRKGYMDSERLESVTIFPISADNEEHSGAVIRISDITEARMMEKAILRSEKLASIGVLSSGIAHEINNPNNFIMFNVPVLRRYLGAILPIVEAHAAGHADFTLFGMPYEAYERDLFELTDSIEKGSERIKNIVSELKAFSYLEDQEKAAWGNPEQTIAQAVRFSRDHLKERVKRFDVDIPEGLPDAFFEAGGLEQVIVNLLINAAHAADKETSWIRLKARIEDGDNRYFVIEITDNGCGIDEKHMTKIFDPFFTTKPPGEGTGLGLYVCHSLIQKVGGSIEVNSTVGEGSNFRIKLLCK